VESAAAFAIPDGDGSLRVHGAVTVREGHTLAAESLRSHLAAALPRYAVPERLSILEAMPRTSTGKIDRRELARLHAAAP
jgi:acyl-coenzyme A synthetase/AMP-(fatty) acid ligase